MYYEFVPDRCYRKMISDRMKSGMASFKLIFTEELCMHNILPSIFSTPYRHTFKTLRNLIT